MVFFNRSTLNFVIRDIIVLIFQFQEFIENDHAHTRLIDENNHRLINDIVNKNFRLSIVNRKISNIIKKDRVYARLTFIETFS